MTRVHLEQSGLDLQQTHRVDNLAMAMSFNTPILSQNAPFPSLPAVRSTRIPARSGLPRGRFSPLTPIRKYDVGAAER